MIVLIPISCWKTASPIATTSAGRTHGCRAARRPPLAPPPGSPGSPRSALGRLLRPRVVLGCTSSSTSRASSSSPVRTRKRGVSGTKNMPISRTTRRHRGQPEHQPPVAGRGEDRVDDERGQDADHDHQLVQRGDRRRGSRWARSRTGRAAPPAPPTRPPRPMTKRAAISTPTLGAAAAPRAPTVNVTRRR